MRPMSRSPGASTGFIFRRWIASMTLSMRRLPGSTPRERGSISARFTTWRRCSNVSPQRASSCPTLALPPIAASAARRRVTCRRFCRITWTRRKSPRHRAMVPWRGETSALLHQLLPGDRLKVLIKNLVVGRLVHSELVENAQRLAHIHGAAFRVERAVGGEHDLVDGEELHAAFGRRLGGERGGVG